MIVKLVAHPDQIRWWVDSALTGFDTLDTETAVANAKSDLRSLLSYLDRTNDAVTVLGLAPAESRIGSELGNRDAKAGYAPNLEIVRS